ncbi:hypothetical protein [Rossellomorea marisflavi]|uniref:hypothetical protein n=1 Tax=Rossellomorea marisflavi TaxID=189381 RepID=UPI003FA01D6F
MNEYLILIGIILFSITIVATIIDAPKLIMKKQFVSGDGVLFKGDSVPGFNQKSLSIEREISTNTLPLVPVIMLSTSLFVAMPLRVFTKVPDWILLSVSIIVFVALFGLSLRHFIKEGRKTMEEFAETISFRTTGEWVEHGEYLKSPLLHNQLLATLKEKENSLKTVQEKLAKAQTKLNQLELEKTTVKDLKDKVDKTEGKIKKHKSKETLLTLKLQEIQSEIIENISNDVPKWITVSFGAKTHMSDDTLENRTPYHIQVLEGVVQDESLPESLREDAKETILFYEQKELDKAEENRVNNARIDVEVAKKFYR